MLMYFSYLEDTLFMDSLYFHDEYKIYFISKIYPITVLKNKRFTTINFHFELKNKVKSRLNVIMQFKDERTLRSIQYTGMFKTKNRVKHYRKYVAPSVQNILNNFKFI